MMILKCCILYTILLPITPFIVASKDNCTVYNENQTYIHARKDGVRSCCYRVICPKGTHGIMCTNGRPDTTRCGSCDGESYYPVEKESDRKMHCIGKKVCRFRSGMVAITNGSTTEDRVCACDLSRGYYANGNQPGYNYLSCQKKKCEAGTELTSEGKCIECKAGYFKPFQGYTLCDSWTHCSKEKGKKIAVHGNATHDSVCKDINEVNAIVPVLGGLQTKEEDFDSTHVAAFSALTIAGLIIIVLILFIARKKLFKFILQDENLIIDDTDTIICHIDDLIASEDNSINTKELLLPSEIKKFGVPSNLEKEIMRIYDNISHQIPSKKDDKRDPEFVDDYDIDDDDLKSDENSDKGYDSDGTRGGSPVRGPEIGDAGQRVNSDEGEKNDKNRPIVIRNVDTLYIQVGDHNNFVAKVPVVQSDDPDENQYDDFNADV